MDDKPKIIQINFRRDEYSDLAPEIINILTSGDLLSIETKSEDKSNRFKNAECHQVSPNSIVISLPYKKIIEKNPIADYDDVELHWIKERQEWIGFYYYEQASPCWPYTDIWVTGPYSLTDDWLVKIAEVFKIDTKEIFTNQIRKMSPNQLKNLKSDKGDQAR